MLDCAQLDMTPDELADTLAEVADAAAFLLPIAQALSPKWGMVPAAFLIALRDTYGTDTQRGMGQRPM